MFNQTSDYSMLLMDLSLKSYSTEIQQHGVRTHRVIAL